MSGRWVLPQLFSVQATTIDWAEEAEILGFDGELLDTGLDPGFLQLRWLLHPSVGLPGFPFMVWHMPHPGGSLDAQQLANHDDWDALELVGLPVDGSWDGTGYHSGRQGPVDRPRPPISGTIAPVSAALRRLQRGAPRIGWAGLTLDGASVDRWESPDLPDYLDQLLASPLLEGVRAMLRDRPDPLGHRTYMVAAEDGRPGGLHPHLLADRSVTLGGPDRPARGSWGPLGLLLVAAGTDPLAALALGFGTALTTSSEDLYMVTVQHRLTVGDVEVGVELADVVSARQLPAPSRPAEVQARVIGGTRPQATDGPALQSIGVAWNRPENPRHTPRPDDPFPASYAVARSGPEPGRAGLLLTRRPEPLRGWLPFVASKPDQLRPVRFSDHLVRSGMIDGEPVADPRPLDVTYAVAAQDVFGRWSRWTTARFHRDGEPPQVPSVLSVEVAASGQTSVGFAWDWTDRRPELVELTGAYADHPGSPAFTFTIRFGGSDEPDPGDAEVLPLDPSRQPATDWGAAQDLDPEEPGLRFYRLRTPLAVDLAGKPERTFQVRARGQRRLDRRWGETVLDPDLNLSSFGPPVATSLHDPEPPAGPVVPEAPQWASLPDPAGVSRSLLTWQGDQRVAGYVLYHATETSLLAALGLPGPDTTRPLTDRLVDLRGASLPAVRQVFRRVQRALIPPQTPTTAHEVALPRGSSVLHLYAVTAMGRNQVESRWPATSDRFIAVAAPRLAVPAPPTLRALPVPEQASVELRVGLGGDVGVRRVELYRTTSEALARSVDTMGRPVLPPPPQPVAGQELAVTDRPAPGWRRIWYRAVAWSARDDQRGVVEARSPASPPVAVLLPPQTAPGIPDLRVNEPGSTGTEALISWTSTAPVEVTPFGPHTAALEAHDAAGGLIARLEGRLDTLPAFDSPGALPPPDPGNRRIVRVGPLAGYRLSAWLPRPVADLFFRVTVKMTDPLGRTGSRTAIVPAPNARLVIVPNVLREPLAEGVQRLRDADLQPFVLEVVLADPEIAVVGRLDPRPGEPVQAGSPVLVEPVDPNAVE